MKTLMSLVAILTLSTSVAFAEPEDVSAQKMDTAKIADANAKIGDPQGIVKLSKVVSQGTPGRVGSVARKFVKKNKNNSILTPANDGASKQQTDPSRPTDQ